MDKSACYQMVLYDGGMAYDIIEEVIHKGYTFSVLDCNALVKSFQRGPAKEVYGQDITGLAAEYPIGPSKGPKRRARR